MIAAALDSAVAHASIHALAHASSAAHAYAQARSLSAFAFSQDHCRACAAHTRVDSYADKAGQAMSSSTIFVYSFNSSAVTYGLEVSSSLTM